MKKADTSGAAANLVVIDYMAENIDPVNLTCFEANKAASTDESNPNAGDGAGDDYADYGKTFDASSSVSGVADVWNQPIAGNFNQLKELKAKYPNLKVILTIGGWTYSKYFSDVAATDASRLLARLDRRPGDGQRAVSERDRAGGGVPDYTAGGDG